MFKRKNFYQLTETLKWKTFKVFQILKLMMIILYGNPQMCDLFIII